MAVFLNPALRSSPVSLGRLISYTFLKVSHLNCSMKLEAFGLIVSITLIQSSPPLPLTLPLHRPSSRRPPNLPFPPHRFIRPLAIHPNRMRPMRRRSVHLARVLLARRFVVPDLRNDYRSRSPLRRPRRRRRRLTRKRPGRHLPDAHGP